MQAMEMKLEGFYVARGLSFRYADTAPSCSGSSKPSSRPAAAWKFDDVQRHIPDVSGREAEFMELPCDLTPEQRARYDTAVEEWRILRVAVQQAGCLWAAAQAACSSLHPSVRLRFIADMLGALHCRRWSSCSRPAAMCGRPSGPHSSAFSSCCVSA